MILLDTNVISELMRPRPEPKVEMWLAALSPADCLLSAITEAELRYGVEILPPGQRRQQFQTALKGMFEQDFAGRILPFDSTAARVYATIAADRRRAGRPISQMDAQIAAIALRWSNACDAKHRRFPRLRHIDCEPMDNMKMSRPKRQIFHVYGNDESFSVLDLHLLTEIEVHPPVAGDAAA